MSALWISTLTEAAVRTTALLGVAATVAFLLRRRAAATRHFVWALALGGALVLPLVGAVLPRVPVPVPTAIADALPAPAANTALPARVAASPAPLATVSRTAPDPFAAPDGGDVARTRVSTADGLPEVGERAAAAPAVSGGTTAGPASSAPEPFPAAQAPGAAVAWQPTLLALWGFGALVFGAWALVGVRSTRRLAREATAVTSTEWLDTLRAALEGLSIRRPVRLLQSGGAVMPMTWGWRRPVILVPAAASGWSPERRAVVLRHELAHVKRGDVLTRLLARWTCAVYWFNPLVWFAAYRLRVECERACDDEVLRLGTRASDYANHLLDIAREYHAPRLRASAAVAMARRSQLEGRMLAILDPKVRRAAGRSTAILAATVLTGAALAVSALTPTAQPPGTAPEPATSPAASGGRERPAEQGAPAGEAAENTAEAQDAGASGERSARIQTQADRARRRAEEMRERVQALSERFEEMPEWTEALNERFEELRERLTQGDFEVLGDRIGTAIDDARRAVASGGVQIQIEDALRTLRRERRELDPRLIEAFIGALRDTDAEVRERAARALGRNRVTEAAAALRTVLGDENADVRERAAWALGRIRDDAAVQGLLGLLDDPEPDVRERAAWALGMLRNPAAVDGLVAALDDADEDVQERIAWALGRIRDDRATDGLITALDLVEGDALEEVIEALGRIGGERALDALIRLLDAPDPEVRREAIAALSGWPEPPPPPPGA